MKIFRIHFEDHGQDFLTWHVTEEGKVIYCEPMQMWLWSKVEVKNVAGLMVGSLVTYTAPFLSRDGSEIRYPIAKVDVFDTDNELQPLMDDIASWSDATFGEGQRNPAILHHLKKEVNELIESVERFQACGIKIIGYKGSEEACIAAFNEYADCLMLLLDSAHHFGLNSATLIQFTRQKLETNKKRKWGNPDCNGVVEHIKVEG